MFSTRKAIMISLISLLIAIIVGGLAFAALSQNLKIGGSGTVVGGNWNISFDNNSYYYDSYALPNQGFTAPVITNSTIGGFSVKIANPGEGAVFTVDVMNKGTINARFVDVVEPTTTFTGSPEDIEIVKNNIKYTILVDGPLAEDAKGTLFPAKNLAVITIMVEYPSTATEFPIGEVGINFGETVLIYEQA